MLISHAKRLLSEDGYACLGLAVTAGNPARATYQAQGFRTVTESQTVSTADGPTVLTGLTVSDGPPTGLTAYSNSDPRRRLRHTTTPTTATVMRPMPRAT